MSTSVPPPDHAHVREAGACSPTTHRGQNNATTTHSPEPHTGPSLIDEAPGIDPKRSDLEEAFPVEVLPQAREIFCPTVSHEPALGSELLVEIVPRARVVVAERSSV